MIPGHWDGQFVNQTWWKHPREEKACDRSLFSKGEQFPICFDPFSLRHCNPISSRNVQILFQLLSGIGSICCSSLEERGGSLSISGFQLGIEAVVLIGSHFFLNSALDVIGRDEDHMPLRSFFSLQFGICLLYACFWIIVSLWLEFHIGVVLSF